MSAWTGLLGILLGGLLAMGVYMLGVVLIEPNGYILPSIVGSVLTCAGAVAGHQLEWKRATRRRQG